MVSVLVYDWWVHICPIIFFCQFILLHRRVVRLKLWTDRNMCFSCIPGEKAGIYCEGNNNKTNSLSLEAGVATILGALIVVLCPTLQSINSSLKASPI